MSDITSARPRRLARRIVAAATSTALIIGGFVAVAQPAAAASGTVTGTVFRDFDGDGVFDTGNAARSGIANDTGLSGVTVTATDATGATVATASSTDSGTYTLTVADAATADLRIQFTVPAGYQPSGTSGGGSNGTSVQFVQLGATGVDFALNVPEDYAQASAPLVTAIQRAGSPFAAEGGTTASRNAPAIVATGYDDNFTGSQPAGFPGQVTLARFGEVGAVQGVVYQASSNSVYALAVYKRQSGLGELGLGGIYRVTDVLDASGQASSAGDVEPWLDVTDPAGLNIDLGAAETNAQRGLGGPQTPAYDTHGFANAGKIGFGGSTLSPDGTTLYFVNLHDKHLYAIDVSDPDNPPTTYESYDLGLGVGERPWAVGIYRDTVYVGYVDSGETAAGAQPGRSAAAADLNAYVISSPLAGIGTWQNVLTVDLGYAKGDVYSNTLTPQSQRWNTWTDTWTWSGGRVAQTPQGNSSRWHIYPQPILSGLYFDEDDYLTLAFADRTAVQSGNRNYSSDSSITGFYETGASGDLLIAAPTGAGYAIENNALVGTRTGTTGGLNEGPGGREFYNDRQNVGTGSYHQEITLGSAVGLRGSREVVATSYDPLAGIRLGGLAWYSVGNGRSLAGYEHTSDGGTSASADGGFQKGGGLGAVSLLAKRAPVEIGNRVWFDADQDGVQDADEPAVRGVPVQLLDADGVVIATTTTDDNGEYYFRSDEDGFDPNGTYTVVFAIPDGDGTVTLSGPNEGAFGALRWSDLTFTEQGVGDAATDSNADPETGRATVVVHGPGANDHRIDAGLIASVPFTVTKLIDEAGGDATPGQTFEIVAAARDFRGNDLTLSQSTFTLAAGETSAPTTVPVGAKVKISETTTGIKTVAISGPGVSDTEGYYPLTGTGGSFAFTVTNTLFSPGTFQVTKQVTGDFALTDDELADAAFTVTYTSAAGGGDLVLNAANGWTATSPELPRGTVVTLSETARTGAAASVAFGTPTWSAGDAGDGTATLTIGDGTNTALTLTNPSTTLLGSFAVTKQVTGPGADRVPTGTTFVVEYSLDAGDTWTALTPVADGATVAYPAQLPLGTQVLLREQAPAPLPDVSWSTPVFSGTGVVTTGGTTTLTIGAVGVAAVTLQNPTAERNGQFTVLKEVTGPGASLVAAGTTFDVDYTSDAGNGRLTVSDGQLATSPALPTGTVVTVTEVTPTGGLPSGAVWGTPTLTVDGVDRENGATFTIGDATTVAIVVHNPTTVTPSVEIHKGDGDAAEGTIAHEADTVSGGEVYAPGETRDIVIRVVNTGPEPLRNVELTDSTLAGATVTNLVWAFPDGTSADGVLDETTGEWSARWDATFDGTTWAVGDTIIGTATLTLDGAAHQDRATVNAVGAFSGRPVSDENDYNAFTGAIQVIKYAGQDYDGATLADPVFVDSDDEWTTPGKPLADAGQDANDADHAVEYPVDTARTVRWIVTNTGGTWLTDITLEDILLDGPAIGSDWTADLSALGGPADYSFVEDGPWSGLFEPGASFIATGTLTLPADTTHADRVDVVGTVVVPATDDAGVPQDAPSLDGEGEPVRAQNEDGSPFTVDDDDPFHAFTGSGPEVTIEKGDGGVDGIDNDADLLDTGVGYAPGTTRTIVFLAENSGDEPLVDIVLTDETVSGGSVVGLTWTLPDGTNLSATPTDSGWTASWAGPWLPGEVIRGTASLTLGASSDIHVDRALVTATGAASGTPVGGEGGDVYAAFTGSIQVIKYDGHGDDPVVSDEDGWVIPAKPLLDEAQDANDVDHAVEYPVGTTNPVRWVVTNTGTTWLTDITLTDTNLTGPAIGDDWTADLSALGGPADYSFVESGPWPGLLAPGASFFATGTLTLGESENHADNVDVIGTVVVPEAGDDGVTPTGNPQLDEQGEPVRAVIPDPENPEETIPFTVADEDPFHAWTGEGPRVDIEKGDGSDGEIAHDADTMPEGQLYENGETRTIVFRVVNTGDEDLVEVTLTDDTLSGASVTTLQWTLPDGTTLDAVRSGETWTARWDATFDGDAVWQPGEVILGEATLTLDGGEPHVDTATVTATGIGSGIPVSDSDGYNAFTAGIQVIKYDGDLPDAAVTDGDGAWIVPGKPLVSAAQDANDEAHAVTYKPDTTHTVRWVVTNTGSTWLTEIDLSDLTVTGPDVTAWTADLSAFGGPATYDFVTSGTWHGLIPPGASFFATGTLTLAENAVHADTVTVVGTPLVPEVDESGVPTGSPQVDEDGNFVPVLDEDGAPVRLTDSDPFHAKAPGLLAVTGLNALRVLTVLLGGALLLVIGAIIRQVRRRPEQIG